jgi:hypothetical protein
MKDGEHLDRYVSEDYDEKTERLDRQIDEWLVNRLLDPDLPPPPRVRFYGEP